MKRSLALCAVSAALVILAGSGSAPARGVPMSVADRYAARTYVEAAGARETYTAVDRRVVTAADGSTITAVHAFRRHTADAGGQIVLLFRGRRFLGWASAYEAPRLNLGAKGDAIVVRYAVFRADDGFCCPSSFKRVAYRFNGVRIVADGEPPLWQGQRGLRLHLA